MDNNNLSLKSKIVLAIQHILAMFGSTILVPILTGLSIPISLLTAGVGTLAFHFFTEKKVPAFISSSFTCIAAVALINNTEGLANAKFAVMTVGFVYLLFVILVKKIGIKKIYEFLPPVVVGPVVMLIGLRLLSVAFSMAGFSNNKFELKSLIISLIVLITLVAVNTFKNKFLKILPVLLAIVVGYVVSICFGIVDFSLVRKAPWIGLSSEMIRNITTLPSFSLNALLMMLPIAVIVLIENIGDIQTTGAVAGKDFFTDPGFDKCLTGLGASNAIAGFLGGPNNTTYGENIGVLTLTKVYDPFILRLASYILIFLSMCGKLMAIFQTIPTPVLGGICITLFGSISSVGIRMLVEHKIDISKIKNLLIVSLILAIGIGIDNIKIGANFALSGSAIAVLVGIVLNKVLKD